MDRARHGSGARAGKSAHSPLLRICEPVRSARLMRASASEKNSSTCAMAVATVWSSLLARAPNSRRVSSTAARRMSPALIRSGSLPELITPVRTAYALENAVVHQGLQHGLEIAWRQAASFRQHPARDPAMPTMERDVGNHSDGENGFVRQERHAPSFEKRDAVVLRAARRATLPDAFVWDGIR